MYPMEKIPLLRFYLACVKVDTWVISNGTAVAVTLSAATNVKCFITRIRVSKFWVLMIRNLTLEFPNFDFFVSKMVYLPVFSFEIMWPEYSSCILKLNPAWALIAFSPPAPILLT
jgi:hypothetical protein